MNPNSDYTTAIHEAGHSTVASHFKIPALPEILDEGRSIATQTTYPNYAGLCSYDEGRIPPLQYAAICWGGQLAECLYTTPPSWAPPYKPSALLLLDWWAAMMVQIKMFSEGDRGGIMACYRQSWRACKTAYHIVKKDQRRIIRLAKALATGRNQPVPMPATFPAGREDFMRLVIAADGNTGDAAKRYDEFLSDRVRAFWASGWDTFEAAVPMLKKHFLETANAETRAAHPGRTDDEISQLMFDQNFQEALANERKRFEKLFGDQSGWTSAARIFRAWTKVKKSTDQIP